MNYLKCILLTCSIGLTCIGANAGSLTSVLDGMLTNVTAPDVVSTQFRGAISGGSVYIRTPVDVLQLVSIDPPRFSAGCGGIDMYLGSFSFITAEKLTQFIRSVAQNAAPLAFKMAIDATFPQLGNVLDKFQAMAQKMNDAQTNSCEMARGMIDASKSNPAGAIGALTDSISESIGVVQGWFSDTSAAVTGIQIGGSGTAAQVNAMTTPGMANGVPITKKAVNEVGNLTWNAINLKAQMGASYFIGDDGINGVASKQIIMSIIGSEIRSPSGAGAGGASTSANATAQTSATQAPLVKSLPAGRLRLINLIFPAIGTDGTKGVPIYLCQDPAGCLSVTNSTFKTSGILGHINKMMIGTEAGTSLVAGSILSNLSVCSTSNCAMTATQLNFLNSVGSVPVVGLIMHAQSRPNIMSAIAPKLIEQMSYEYALQYGTSVLDLVTSTFSYTDIPKPEGYSEAISNLQSDLTYIRDKIAHNVEEVNKMTTFIDGAIRANASAMRYRPNK